MNREIRVGQIGIGPSYRPFVIAEMSGNHNGSLERALEIVDAAADAGAQALKIQTYTADTMTLDLKTDEFFIDDKSSLWHGSSLYELYQEAATPYEWHGPIFDRCRRRGVLGFSTPFDPTAVDFLETFAPPLYKIASFENTDLPLIRRVAKTKKPMIISTGMASEEEIGDAVEAARSAGCRDLVLLKCTSAYPADPGESHLATIPEMMRRFGVPVGLSDHTLGLGASLASVALGAVAIERHVTLRRSDGGVDSAFSLEPAELSSLVVESERAWKSVGQVRFGPSDLERSSLRFRRSLYVTRDLEAGEELGPANVRPIRPGLGLPPKHYDAVIGKRIVRAAKRGTPLTWDLIGGEKGKNAS